MHWTFKAFRNGPINHMQLSTFSASPKVLSFTKHVRRLRGGHVDLLSVFAPPTLFAYTLSAGCVPALVSVVYVEVNL